MGNKKRVSAKARIKAMMAEAKASASSSGGGRAEARASAVGAVPGKPGKGGAKRGKSTVTFRQGDTTVTVVSDGDSEISIGDITINGKKKRKKS
ncbi:MAG: hypothetical protein HQL50_09220 [Magnetococcales bacterium]|nr:hypothetical protein [Magnetococcales bacterium]